MAEHMMDFDEVAKQYYSPAMVDNAGRNIVWNNIRVLRTSSTHPDSILIKYDYSSSSSISDNADFVEVLLMRRGQPVPTLPAVNPLASQSSVTKAKKADLVWMCKELIIPHEYHNFYETLPVGSDNTRIEDVTTCGPKKARRVSDNVEQIPQSVSDCDEHDVENVPPSADCNKTVLPRPPRKSVARKLADRTNKAVSKSGDSAASSCPTKKKGEDVATCGPKKARRVSDNIEQMLQSVSDCDEHDVENVPPSANCKNTVLPKPSRKSVARKLADRTSKTTSSCPTKKRGAVNLHSEHVSATDGITETPMGCQSRTRSDRKRQHSDVQNVMDGIVETPTCYANIRVTRRKLHP